MQGLDAVPPADRPPVNVVRFAFQTMVGIGTMLALLGVVFVAVRVRRRRLPESRWFYRALVAAGPLSVVALIAGWVTTEVGRQPWVVYRVMPTADAVTGAGGIPVGYTVLGAHLRAGRDRTWLWTLRRLAAVPLELEEASAMSSTFLSALPLVFVLAGVVLYAVLAGADLGAGFWQLFAGRGRHGEEIREHAHHSMAPVWEANHVWLIFVLTVFWTAYPTAFGSIASTLAIPLFLAGIGIVFRGAAYALRVGASTPRELGVIDTVFSLSSILTPFALGTMVGAIATRRVPVGNAAGQHFSSWLNSTSILDRRPRRRHLCVSRRRLSRCRRGAARRARPRASVPGAGARRGRRGGCACTGRDRRRPQRRATRCTTSSSPVEPCRRSSSPRWRDSRRSRSCTADASRRHATAPHSRSQPS